jgi:hypothetical protein
MWNTASGVLAASPTPRTLPFAQNLMTNGFLRGYVASQAKKQVAKRAPGALSGPVRDHRSLAEVQR